MVRYVDCDGRLNHPRHRRILWGDMGGTISTERFTLDGATYRVIFLIHYADGLYFGTDGKLATDFTLRIGDAEYTAQESSTPNSPKKDTGGESRISTGPLETR